MAKSYLGGGTVIGPRSGWFGNGNIRVDGSLPIDDGLEKKKKPERKAQPSRERLDALLSHALDQIAKG